MSDSWIARAVRLCAWVLVMAMVALPGGCGPGPGAEKGGAEKVSDGPAGTTEASPELPSEARVSPEPTAEPAKADAGDSDASSQPEPPTEAPKEAPPKREEGCGNCPQWQRCEGGKCVAKSCKTDADCSDVGACVKDSCRSRIECCRKGDTQCQNNQESPCVLGADGCGKWGPATVCPDKNTCDGNKCTSCRHRACTSARPCCSGYICSFGYCLPECDKSKGELDNPDCCDRAKDPKCERVRDFCFEPSPGAKPLCIPDGNEPKGAKCSIVKPCGPAYQCVDIQDGRGFLCYSACSPSKGALGNPDCDAKEECKRALNVAKGGLCVPTTKVGKKLHEACAPNSPCLAPNLCLGQPGASVSYCLAPCDPTQNPSTCPASDLCAGYDSADPKKGVCLQKCSNPGTKDNCTYGQCVSQSNEKVCL